MLVRVFLALALSIPLLAQAEVLVSRTFQTNPLSQVVSVKAGSYWAKQLPGGRAGDTFKIQVIADNQVYKDITVMVVDQENLAKLKANKPYQGIGQQKAATPYVFTLTRNQEGPLFLVVDNRYSLMVTKKVRVYVTWVTELRDEQITKLQGYFGHMNDVIHTILDLPDFTFIIKPLDDVNAFSTEGTGNITLSTELVAKYSSNDPVMEWVVLHELGHTALGLWGIPGNDNEDMADEFATAFMLHSKDGSKKVLAAMSFFKDADNRSQAQHMIEHGDRHSLSIQRVRNVMSWVIDPIRVTGKWNKLLYPHMTDQTLREIVDKPNPYDDAALAKEVIAKRAVLGGGPLSGASMTATPIANMGGCMKDTDCKGNRICERGVCVSP